VLKAGRREFDSQQEFSLLHSVQIDTGAHPVFYPKGTSGFFVGVKAAGA
jgi:hypothetical protein